MTSPTTTTKTQSPSEIDDQRGLLILISLVVLISVVGVILIGG
jgi:hypothetical protein